MAYSAAKIHAVGDILTASDWDTMSNDISFLAGTLSQYIETNETTTSTSYTDLSTVGPSVMVTTGANAIVMLTATLGNATASTNTYMGFAVSGATTIAASDIDALTTASQGTINMSMSAVYLQTSLTPGPNTFTAKYRVTGGTGSYLNRCITVIPLP